MPSRPSSLTRPMEFSPSRARARACTSPHLRMRGRRDPGGSSRSRVREFLGVNSPPPVAGAGAGGGCAAGAACSNAKSCVAVAGAAAGGACSCDVGVVDRDGALSPLRRSRTLALGRALGLGLGVGCGVATTVVAAGGGVARGVAWRWAGCRASDSARSGVAVEKGLWTTPLTTQAVPAPTPLRHRPMIAPTVAMRPPPLFAEAI